jgi:uncharacterized protein (UPF0332 family)
MVATSVQWAVPNRSFVRPSTAEATVDKEFEWAEQKLAMKAQEIGISKATVANRLYYACFHVAQAAVYTRGFDHQSHGWVQTCLGQEMTQPGDVPRELGRFLNDMQTYRRRVDYGSGGVDRDGEGLLKQMAAFLDAMRQISGHDGST